MKTLKQIKRDVDIARDQALLMEKTNPAYKRAIKELDFLQNIYLFLKKDNMLNESVLQKQKKDIEYKIDVIVGRFGSYYDVARLHSGGKTYNQVYNAYLKENNIPHLEEQVKTLNYILS